MLLTRKRSRGGNSGLRPSITSLFPRYVDHPIRKCSTSVVDMLIAWCIDMLDVFENDVFKYMVVDTNARKFRPFCRFQGFQNICFSCFVLSCLALPLRSRGGDEDRC